LRKPQGIKKLPQILEDDALSILGTKEVDFTNGQ
jgi:hypothetical protein